MDTSSHVGLSRSSRIRVLLVIAGASLLSLYSSAQGRFDSGSGTPPALDVAFDVVFQALSDASRSTFAADVTDQVDLHDGRSSVPYRWQKSFERFAASDRAVPPVAGGIVFVGSSSIELWRDLPTQFPAFNIVQRGLGGATIADCTRHADRLILPYRPRIVVVYAGDNDLAAGLTPESVAGDYAELVATVQRALPKTRFVYLSIKPSPLRAALMPRIGQTNALVAAYTRTDPHLDFVDVHDAMLDRDARARRELFVADGLHMTSAGYAIWRDALIAHLD